MEPSGRNRWQRSQMGELRKGSNRRFGNRWQPVATVPKRMAKRGRPRFTLRVAADAWTGHAAGCRLGQRCIPRSSRRRSPEAPVCTRQSSQRHGRRGTLTAEIPTYSRPARKYQDRPVTPEVAGSSPVAPVSELPATKHFPTQDDARGPRTGTSRRSITPPPPRDPGLRLRTQSAGH
jgi:hypothetical protein